MGKRRKEKATARGEITIEGTTYKYALYKRPPGKPWLLKFIWGPGKARRGIGSIKNGNTANVTTITERIRESLRRRATVNAAAPAPARAPSPFRSGRPGTVRQSIPHVPHNISHDETGAKYATKRAYEAEVKAAKRRRTAAAAAKRPRAPPPPPPPECPICLEHLDDASPALACRHRFHAACVQELVAKAWADGAKRTRGRGTAVLCPLCREQSYVQ